MFEEFNVTKNYNTNSYDMKGIQINCPMVLAYDFFLLLFMVEDYTQGVVRQNRTCFI